jgi:PhnB protein
VSDVPGFAQTTQANLFVYVPDVDASFASAVAAGAKAIQPVTDMFWVDRWGMVADPCGTVWQIATHKETISTEEMMARMQAAAKG